jgi:hypothetical protein
MEVEVIVGVVLELGKVALGDQPVAADQSPQDRPGSDICSVPAL